MDVQNGASSMLSGFGAAYEAADEGTHPFEGIDLFNESVILTFRDPISQLGAMIRLGNRPTLGYQEATVELFLPGENIAYRGGRAPSTRNDEFAGQGLKFDFKVPGETIEVTYENNVALISNPSLLSYEGRRTLKNSPSENCQIELTWSSVCPVFTVHEPEEGLAGSSTWATEHFEQYGVVSGRVQVGTRTWILDKVMAVRDHSWGPREWASYYGEVLFLFMADGSYVSAYRELPADAGRASYGRALVGGELRRVTDFDVFSDYLGEPTYPGRYCAALTIEGAPVIPLDGTIRNFVPLTQATGETGVRLTQMNIDFVGANGAWAYAEWLRPIGR